MKLNLIFVLGITLSASCFSQSVGIPDYDWKLNDITSLGQNKETIFSKMDRDLIKVNQSICSNRAHLWAYDLKENFSIDSAKIFLFFTPKTGTHGDVTWWYHVAPVINEAGNIWVMDAGFPRRIKKPLTTEAWLKEFTKTGNCKAINANETDLIEHIFTAHTYPEVTAYGKYDCYYKITPAGYWTPGSVATNILGRFSDGTPVNYRRDEIKRSEVYSACLEAVTSSFGRFFGGGKQKCRKYLAEK